MVLLHDVHLLLRLTLAPGSSTVCGNAGIPATPRDGSPIELVALQASALRWLAQLQQQGVIDARVVVRLKVFSNVGSVFVFVMQY